MNRRDLLRAFLGAPAALIGAGCRPTAPPLPPGVLVGPSVGIGHRLRSPDSLPMVGADEWTRTGVVVIGAGVAGLTAAWALRRAGVDDVVVLELEPVAGGTARSGTSAVGGYPWGAHYVPVPAAHQTDLIELLTEIGAVEGLAADGTPIPAEQIVCREPEERLFYRGRWEAGLFPRVGMTADDERQLRRFEAEIDRWVGWRDTLGRRAFILPRRLGSDDPAVRALDRDSMAAWMAAHNFTSDRLRWWVEYACRDDYGATMAGTSAWAALFYFAARKEQPGEPEQPVFTWPEGNGRLVRHLKTGLGSRLRTGTLVTRIAPGDRSVEVTALDAATGRALGFRADRAVFAGPMFLAGHLVQRDGWQAPTGFTSGPWMVANLHLRDRPSNPTDGGFPLCWDNVLHDSPALGYVVSTHQTERDFGPTVFTYYYPLTDLDPAAARRRLLSIGRDGWAEVALSDLERPHPELRGLVERLDVMRWGHAMIRPRPGFMWSDGLEQARRPVGGLHFAHADLSGLPLFEEAFDHGLRAARAILADLNPRP